MAMIVGNVAADRLGDSVGDEKFDRSSIDSRLPPSCHILSLESIS